MARKSKQDYARLLDKLYEENMLWFVLGSMISSDSYICSKEEGLKRRNEAIKQLQGFVDNINKTNIPNETKQAVKKFALDGVKLLNDEIQELCNALNA